MSQSGATAEVSPITRAPITHTYMQPSTDPEPWCQLEVSESQYRNQMGSYMEGKTSPHVWANHGFVVHVITQSFNRNRQSRPVSLEFSIASLQPPIVLTSLAV